MNLIDYQIQSLKYIIPYLRPNADVKAILYAIGSRFTNLQDAVSYLVNSLDLNDARGVWLDYAGTEVGAQRDEKDFGDYFCVNRNHVNVEKRFYFLSSGLNPEVPLSLSDAEFIQKIFAYIGANSACGTRNEIINIVQTITNANAVFVTKTDKHTIKIKLAGEALILTQNTISYIQQILGDGVYLEDIETMKGE